MWVQFPHSSQFSIAASKNPSDIYIHQTLCTIKSNRVCQTNILITEPQNKTNWLNIGCILHTFEQDYVIIRFDVVSLLTRVPVDRTIEIILKIIHEDKSIITFLKKYSMNRFITDVCKKTVFSFNNAVLSWTNNR